MESVAKGLRYGVETRDRQVDVLHVELFLCVDFKFALILLMNFIRELYSEKVGDFAKYMAL